MGVIYQEKKAYDVTKEEIDSETERLWGTLKLTVRHENGDRIPWKYEWNLNVDFRLALKVRAPMLQTKHLNGDRQQSF